MYSTACVVYICTIQYVWVHVQYYVWVHVQHEWLHVQYSMCGARTVCVGASHVL